MRIGLLVGDPEIMDKFLIDKSRPWLKQMNKKYITNRRNPYAILKPGGNFKNRILNKKGKYVDIYMSIYYYLIDKYSMANGEYHHIDLIYPNEISYDRLMKNDINFYNFYDPVAAGIGNKGRNINKAGAYRKLLNSLPEHKVYPPANFLNLQTDKCAYYSFFKKHGIKTVDTQCISSSDWKKSQKIPFPHKQMFVKPVMGTSGADTTYYPKEGETKEQATKRMKQFMTRLFKDGYQKIIIQEFVPGFATESEEYRSLFVGKDYKYTTVSRSVGNGNGSAYAMAILKQNGGTFQASSAQRAKAISFGKKVVSVLQKHIFKDVPQLITRVDTGTDKGKLFLNEIEFAPAYFTSWFKKDSRIDVAIAEQMMKIARTVYTNQMKKLKKVPVGKKPKLSNLQTTKPISFPKKKLPVYLLGCYNGLCKKNKSMYRRLQVAHQYFREAKMTSMVNPVGIFWKEDFNKEQLAKMGMYQETFQEMKLGEIGNMFSHLLALRTFLKTTKNSHCIVLEDDAWVKHDFVPKLQIMLSTLKKRNIKWDIMWLHNNGWHEYTKPWKNEWKLINNAFTKRNPVQFKQGVKIPYKEPFQVYPMKKNFVGSTAGYIINRKAAEIYLKHAFPIGMRPTDVYMQTQFPGIKQWSVHGASRILNQSLEGVFMYSDTADSVIQLNS